MSLRDNENNLIFSRSADIMTELNGDVPKWLKGADSKSARRRKACGGSNPSISANKKTTSQGGFLIGSDEGFEPIKCRCPVDICLPPVSTAATHLFSFLSGNENANQIPPSPPKKHCESSAFFIEKILSGICELYFMCEIWLQHVKDLGVDGTRNFTLCDSAKLHDLYPLSSFIWVPFSSYLIL